MKAYELHTYCDGQWQIDSIFDDRDLALFEARRIDENSRSRYAGVKIVEEVFDPDSNLTTTRTIYRGGRAARRTRTVPDEPRKAPTSSTKEPRKRRGERDRPPASPPPGKTSSYTTILLLFAVILLGGLAAMLGLQELSETGRG